MSKIEDRYSIVPQMKLYDQVSCEFKPYIMFFNKSNFISKVVNTDDLGFRLNFYKGKLSNKSDFLNNDEVSLVIGGSTAFGFGATSDEYTLSSLLSTLTNDPYINFGATAFNSKQEILLFLNFFQKYKKIKNVIILSGINDLYLGLNQEYDKWGNYFFKKKYENIYDKKKFKYKIKNFFFKKSSIIKKNEINYNALEVNYNENFNLWVHLSKTYNFNIHYFLQAFPDWFYKELTNEEKKIFYILDNAKNESHNTLKELSNINNYNKFLDILNRCSSENNLKFTDLNNDLKNDQNSKKWLFVDRVHMTDFGYKFLSKLILNKI